MTEIEIWEQIKSDVIKGNNKSFIAKVEELGGDVGMAEKSTQKQILYQIDLEITALENRWY